MPDPRLPLHGAAEFLEKPQAGRLEAAHQGDGFALPVHHLLLLARMDAVARRLSRSAGVSRQPAADLAPLSDAVPALSDRRRPVVFRRYRDIRAAADGRDVGHPGVHRQLHRGDRRELRAVHRPRLSRRAFPPPHRAGTLPRRRAGRLGAQYRARLALRLSAWRRSDPRQDPRSADRAGVELPRTAPARLPRSAADADAEMAVLRAAITPDRSRSIRRKAGIAVRFARRLAPSRTQSGFFRRKRRIPPGCSLASTSWQPVVWQKCSKSLVAPGSVASTSRTPPAGTAFRARRAFNTGSGQSSPVASSVVVAAPVVSAIASPRSSALRAHPSGFSDPRRKRQPEGLPDTRSRRVVVC